MPHIEILHGDWETRTMNMQKCTAHQKRNAIYYTAWTESDIEHKLQQAKKSTRPVQDQKNASVPFISCVRLFHLIVSGSLIPFKLTQPQKWGRIYDIWPVCLVWPLFIRLNCIFYSMRMAVLWKYNSVKMSPQFFKFVQNLWQQRSYKIKVIYKSWTPTGWRLVAWRQWRNVGCKRPSAGAPLPIWRPPSFIKCFL